MSKRKLSDDGPDAEDRGAKLVADLTALNKEFSSWVSASAKDKQGYFWDMACEDYIAHAKKLREEYADNSNPSKKSATESPKTATPLAFVSSAATSTPANSSPLIFGSTPPAATSSSEPVTTFSFGSQPASQPTTSLFGVAASSAPATSTAPSFSAGTSGFGGFSSSGFNFSSGSTATFGLPASATQPARGGDDADGGEGAEEEDEGDKFDGKVEKDDKTTVLFNEKAVVHFGEGAGAWVKKGTGPLTIRESKEASRPFLMLSTDAGRMLLSCSIPKGCKAMPAAEDPSGKSKLKKLLTNLAVVEDGKGKMAKVMVSLGNAEKRDELVRLLISLGGN